MYEDKLFWTNDATGYAIFKCKVFDTTDIQCESVPIQVFVPIEIFMISQQAKQINGIFHLNMIIYVCLILLLVAYTFRKIKSMSFIFKTNIN